MEVQKMDKPTEKQLNAIRNLARATKSSVNLNKIASKQEASKIIDELIGKRNNNNNNNHDSELKDKKAAYGLATKLVFCRYKQLNIDYKKAENFWKDVEDFYKQYLQHQDRAL